MNNQDFFNKCNRYSIRKITVGAASVIVGATLFANANDAQAAENTTSGETTNVTTTTESTPQEQTPTTETKTQSTTTNETTATQDQTPAQDTSATNTTDAKAEQTVAGEQASTDSTQQSTETTAPKADAPATTETKAPTNETTADTTATEQNTTAKEQAPKTDAQTTTDTNTANTTTTEPKTTESNTDQTVDKQTSTTNTSAQQESQSTQDAQPTQENALNTSTPVAPVEAPTTGTNETTTTGDTVAQNATAPANETTTQQAQSVEPQQDAQTTAQAPVSDAEQPAYDPNAAQLSDANATTAATVGDTSNTADPADLNKSVQDYSNQKDSSEVLAAPTNTTATRSTEQPTQEGAAQTFALAQAAPTGNNVDGDVTASNIQIGPNSIQANDSESTYMSADLAIADSVQAGDYFNVQFPEYLNYYGNSTPSSSKIPDLMNGTEVVATGAFNPDSNSLTYTFSDYVNNHDNVTGHFEIPLYADRQAAPTDGTYPVQTNVAGETYSTDIDINYRTSDSPYPSNVDSFITTTDRNTGEYRQIVYVNPQGKQSYNATVNLYNY